MNKQNLAWKFLYKKFKSLPLKKNKILFESFEGCGYNDSPYAISEHITNNDLDFDLVWALNYKIIKDVDYANIITTKKVSISYLFHLATAKYIITNGNLPEQFVKREGQIIVQTWQGTPLKKLVLDIENNHFPNTSKIDYIIKFLEDVKRWDYLISPSSYATSIFRNAFAYEGEILEIGLPKNDRLINFHPDEVTVLKERLNLPNDKKVLLYTPTFREHKYNEKGKYLEENKLNFAQIVKNNPDWIILVRSHYLVNKNSRFKNKNIIDVSKYSDLNDLFIVSDCLLTDYSSTMFDYSILNRPIIKFAYDLDEYEHKYRGFYIDYKADIPATSIENEGELSELLSNFEHYQNFWTEEMLTFNQRFNSLANGKSTKQFVQKVLTKK